VVTRAARLAVAVGAELQVVSAVQDLVVGAAIGLAGAEALTRHSNEQAEMCE
jgi:hypothetical protein